MGNFIPRLTGRSNSITKRIDVDRFRFRVLMHSSVKRDLGRFSFIRSHGCKILDRFRSKGQDSLILHQYGMLGYLQGPGAVSFVGVKSC